MDLYYQYLLSAFIFLLIFVGQLVEGQIELCHDVYAPFLPNEMKDNCSLVCTLKLHIAMSNVNEDELALCIKNSSIAVFCASPLDCRHYHAGAYCKTIPCFCKGREGKPHYFLDALNNVPRLNTCVVSARYVNPELPIFPFPWKTLIIVFTIVITFMLILVAFRCLTTRIRKWQAKRSRGEVRQRTSEDNATLFSSMHSSQMQREYATPFTTYFPRGMPRIYRANPRSSQHNRSRQVPRVHYTACAQVESSLSDTLTNQDKPPPYEAAVMPPSYEDVQRALSEERVEIHLPPNSSTLPSHIP